MRRSCPVDVVVAISGIRVNELASSGLNPLVASVCASTIHDLHRVARRGGRSGGATRSRKIPHAWTRGRFQRGKKMVQRKESVATVAEAAALLCVQELEYYDNVFTQRVNLWQTSPRLRDMLFDAGRGRTVK